MAARPAPALPPNEDRARRSRHPTCPEPRATGITTKEASRNIAVRRRLVRTSTSMRVFVGNAQEEAEGDEICHHGTCTVGDKRPGDARQWDQLESSGQDDQRL